MPDPTRRPLVRLDLNPADDPLAEFPYYLDSLDPTGFWLLDDVTGTVGIDRSGNGHDLTYINGPTLSAGDSPFKSEGDLDRKTIYLPNGTSGYGQTAISSVWRNFVPPWTFMIWIYITAARDATNNQWTGIMIPHNAAVDVNRPFGLWYGKMGFYSILGVWGGVAPRHVQDSSPPLNTWIHYALRAQGTTLELLKNGVVVASRNDATNLAAAAADIAMRIGRAGDGHLSENPNFPGYLYAPIAVPRWLETVEIQKAMRYHTVRPVDEANFVTVSVGRDILDVRTSHTRSDPTSPIAAGTASILVDNRDNALLPPPIVNLLPNPSAEMNDLTVPFVGRGGALTREPGGVYGRWAWVLRGASGSATADMTSQRGGLVGMRPGKTYTFSIEMYLPTATYGANLIANPGFETDTSGWTTSTTGVTISRTTAEKRSGVASLQVVVDGPNKGCRTTGHTLTAGQTYRARVWVKNTAGRTARIQAFRADFATSLGFTDVVTTGAWQALDLDFTSAASETVYLYVYDRTGASTFYVDDAELNTATSLGIALSDVEVQIVDEVAGVEEVAQVNPTLFDQYHRPSVTKTIRANADAAYVRVRFTTGGSASKYAVLDAAQLEPGSSASAYCDGDQPDGVWDGEPHRSLSRRARTVGGKTWKKVGPMMRFRLAGEWAGTPEWLMQGYVEEISYPNPGGGSNRQALLTVSDGSRVLAGMSMRGFSRPAERVGARLRAIFDFVGIDPAEVDVDDQYIAAETVRAVTVSDDTDARSLVRKMEETEGGTYYYSKDGMHTYRGSLYRSVERVEDFVLKDEDVAPGMPFVDLIPRQSAAQVVNDVILTNAKSGAVTRAKSPRSISRHFPISKSISQEWDTNIVKHVDRSAARLYADGLRVHGEMDPARLWPLILGLDLGQLGRVERQYLGTDIFEGLLFFLEGIQHTITEGLWTTSLLALPTVVTPTDPQTWLTPISRPIQLVSYYASPGGSPIVLPSRTYYPGRRYVVFENLWTTNSVGPPVAPSHTLANATFASIVSATGSSFASWRHQAVTFTVSAETTGQLQLSFAGQAPTAQVDIVVVEIKEGVSAIGVSAAGGTGSAYSGSLDAGTLQDAESVVLGAVWKDANADTSWAGGTELYDRAGPGTDAYSVSHNLPGDDTIDFSWAQANGWHALAVELRAV